MVTAAVALKSSLLSDEFVLCVKGRALFFLLLLREKIACRAKETAWAG